MTPKGPLAKTRIVEWPSENCSLPVRLAIAFAGRIAAGLGAEVVSIVAAQGDPIRDIEPRIGERSALSAFLEVGKTPLINERGADRAGLIGAPVDAIICDDAMFDELADSGAANILAVLSLRGAPQGRLDSEFTIMASSGLLDLVGDPERAPLRLGGHQLAYSCGLAAYAGMLAALCKRRGADRPEIVRTNLADVAVWLNWKCVAMTSWSNRLAARLGQDAEWQIVRCADGWVALVYLEADWPVLREFVDDPRLREARFDNRLERRKNARFITGIIEAAFLRWTRREIRDVALAKRLPLGPVWSPVELEADSQNTDRAFLNRIEVDAKSLLMPRLPLIWDGRTFPATGAASASVRQEESPVS